jgi:flagellar basal body-associated protein FliL
MKEEEKGRQMKLKEIDQEGKVVKKKSKKKRNKPRDRWVVLAVLFVTVLVSLGFYFVSGGAKVEKGINMKETKKADKVKDGADFFGSAVYEF